MPVTNDVDGGGQDAFGEGEQAFSSSGVALISAANAIGAVCG